MRWLSRAFSPFSARLGNESGATIVFISVVLIGLMAMTAFVIDFGRIWQERRELQTGATAAALAIGEDCARDLCDGSYDALGTAEYYADANASDGAAAIVNDPYPDLISQTVHVVTGTKNTSGGNTMGMLFAGIIGFDTATIGANASVAWGTPLIADALPLIISDCEWQRDLPGYPNGSSSGLPDAEANLDSFPRVTLTFHDPGGGDECTVQPGLDLPGGFGFLDTSGGCVSLVTLDGQIGTSPGNAPPCSPADLAAVLSEPVLIPYFSELQGTGNNIVYTVAGYGAFVIDAYDFGGQWKAGGVSCGPGVNCMTGWFVDYVMHGGGPGGLGGNDRGFTVIKLIG
jgi:Flp pilus assembly protein TadG